MKFPRNFFILAHNFHRMQLFYVCKDEQFKKNNQRYGLQGVCFNTNLRLSLVLWFIPLCRQFTIVCFDQFSKTLIINTPQTSSHLEPSFLWDQELKIQLVMKIKWRLILLFSLNIINHFAAIVLKKINNLHIYCPQRKEGNLRSGLTFLTKIWLIILFVITMLVLGLFCQSAIQLDVPFIYIGRLLFFQLAREVFI